MQHYLLLIHAARQLPRHGRLAAPGDTPLTIEVARNPMTPSEKLEKIAKDIFDGLGSNWFFEIDPEGDEWSTLVAIAANPSINNATTRMVLWGGEDIDELNIPLAEALGSNASRIIGRLEDPELSERVDGFVAKFTRIPDQLRELAFHPSADVREMVAENSATPDDIREALAYDPEKYVREAADRGKLGSPQDWFEEARNPATLSDRLRQLAHMTADRFASEQRRRELHLLIAANPNTSMRTLREMISPSNPDVVMVDVIAKNPGRILARLAGDPESVELDMAIASNTDNADALRELAMSSDETVRLAVAVNSHTPADIREALARDPSEEVVAGATLWSNDLSEATQLRLATHPSFQVQSELIRNTRLSSVLEKMVEESSDFRDEQFWWGLKQNPKVSRAILKTWVKRYNRETGEELTLKEFLEWEP